MRWAGEEVVELHREVAASGSFHRHRRHFPIGGAVNLSCSCTQRCLLSGVGTDEVNVSLTARQTATDELFLFPRDRASWQRVAGLLLGRHI